jgi:hypothetical protein
MNDIEKRNIKHCVIVCLVLVALFVMLVIYVDIDKSKKVDGLSTKGIATSAIVVQHYISNKDYVIVCKFFINGLTYRTEDKVINGKNYQVGDTVKIIYLPDDPSVYKIIDQ